MFRVKICGITDLEGADACLAAGADAIGLNFYPPSRRFVPAETARAISQAVSGRLLRVGVFVSCPVEEVRAGAEYVGLDAVQLHGDEPPQDVAALHPLPVVKAFRVQDGCRIVEDYLAQCRELGVLPAMILLDAWSPDAPGGTGKTFDWSAAADFVRREPDRPVALAGGLRPENVAQAIHAVRPWGVDTAGGVESSPGKKSPRQIAAFVQAARTAFRECGIL
ncbi:MAG: phosphoribosylanthranilate isomerase [Thermogutta sp.]|nr:phosphoribosylanthranilate isomerase [Thermogutta sp.]